MSGFREQLKKPFGALRTLFKKRPVSAACLVVGTVLLAALLVEQYDPLVNYPISDARRTLENALEEFMAVFALFAVGVFLAETAFQKGKWAIKVPLFLASAAAALVLVGPQMGSDSVYLRSFCIAEADRTEVWTRFLAAWILVLVCLTVYFCQNRSQLTLSRWGLGVLSRCVESGIIFGVIALGLAVLSAIFNELLWDAGAYVFLPLGTLVGGLYLGANVLECMISGGDAPSRFLTSTVRYVLLGLCACGYLIVYVYVIGILARWTFPSNSVFGILAGLFAATAPVCCLTLAEKKNDFPHKAAFMLPMLFLPLTAVQGLCMGMRIAQYGLTPSRYLGAAFVLIELVWVFLHVKKKGQSQFIFPLLAAAAVFVTVIPGVNCAALSDTMQTRTLRAALAQDTDTLEGNARSRLEAAADYVREYGRREKFIAARFSPEEQPLVTELVEELSGRSFESYVSPLRIFPAVRGSAGLDVEGCRRVSYVSADVSRSKEDPPLELANVPLMFHAFGSSRTLDESEHPEPLLMDASALAEAVLDSRDSEEPFEPEWPLPGGRMLRLMHVTASVDRESGELRRLSFEGYLLEK